MPLDSNQPSQTAATPPPRIRTAERDDRPRMVELWESAVRATHSFLDEAEIAALRPAVVDVVASTALQWWVYEMDGRVAGFLGLVGPSVEALFIDPAYHRRGIGRALVAHAQQVNAGALLSVDVNEANAGAVEFYRRVGFEIRGRSPTDGDGRPYPLLHLARPMPR